MNHTAATIASRSHLGLAHCMAASFLAHHPEGHVVVLLVDGPASVPELEHLGVTTLLAAELEIADLSGMRARYTTNELCNALKPYLLTHLLGEGGCDRALYLDSDIYVVDTLVPDVFAVLDDAAVLLTPHLVSAPGFGAEAVTQELALLLRGSLNGGLVGVRRSPDATRFLRWWSDRVTLAGYDRLDRGMNCDQRWLDLVPGLDLDVRISKHPGLNVAYWNLHERTLSRRDGRWYCNDEPLRFVHFSGFPVDEPTAVTRHWSRYNLENRSDVAGLAEEYRAALRASLAETVTRRSVAVPPATPPLRVAPARSAVGETRDVTVVVPVHNSAHFLSAAAESALAQEGVNLELIVVDDGSTDNPASVMPSDARASLLTIPPAGVSAARNRGLEAARGRMVVFLDSDDVISDGFRLRDQLALLDRQAELGIVHSGWDIVDEQERLMATRTPWVRLPDMSLEHLVGYPAVLPSAMAFRREALEQVGGFDANLRTVEDVDLVFRLLLRGWQAGWLERVTTRYRRHGANKSSNIDAQAEAHTVIFNRLFSDPDLPPSVSRQQRSVRYNTHVWFASRYYRAGRSAAMADHLAASAVFADSGLARLPLDWVTRFADAAADAGDPPPNVAALTADPAWVGLTRLPAGALLERGMAVVGAVDSCPSVPAARPPAAGGGRLRRTVDPGGLRPLPALDLSGAVARSYGRHRSGWSVALDALLPLHVDGGVVVDGFVEHTFHEGGEPYRSPWIGFLHNPPDKPAWYPIDQSATWLLADPNFRASLANCQGLFTLSTAVRDWWSQRVEVPVERVPYPATEPQLRFAMDRFLTNPFPRVVQVGTWLRKLHAIHDLPVRGLQRTIVHQHAPYIEDLFRIEREALRLQVDESSVETLPYLDDQEYDELLSCNLVFVELYAAGANNVVVECVARATPIVVNPLPAVREYLGDDYALYFSSRTEAARKAEDLALVAEAHHYLAKLASAGQLSLDYFLSSVAESEIYRRLSGVERRPRRSTG